MKTLNMAVQGMTCQHCVHHVTEALKEVPGVESVEVSLDNHAATLQVGDDFAEPSAAAALDDAGYTMGEVQAG